MSDVEEDRKVVCLLREVFVFAPVEIDDSL